MTVTTVPPRPSQFIEAVEHANHAARLPEFFAAVRRQEAFHVDAGLPAKGSATMMAAWFQAWLDRDTDAIVACCSEDVAFIDPGTSGLLVGRSALWDYTERFFVGVPDLRFYPQDGANVLPYWDFFGDKPRVTMPWRAVGRFSGTLDLPDWPPIGHTDRVMNFVGIDRYVLNDRWEIERIDTDYDLVGILQQVGLLPSFESPVVKAALAGERFLAAPLVRRFGKS